MINFGDAVLTLQKIKAAESCNDRNAPHSHSYYELHLVTKGAAVYRIGESGVKVNAGEMIIIEPEIPHRRVDPNDDSEIAVLGILLTKGKEGHQFYEYFTSTFNENSEKPLRLSRTLFHKFLNYYLASTLNSIRQHCHRKLDAYDIVVTILDTLSGSEPVYKETDATSFDIMLETFIQTPSITLAEMASRLGYSQRQLSRIIRAHYGKGLRQLRKELQ